MRRRVYRAFDLPILTIEARRQRRRRRRGWRAVEGQSETRLLLSTKLITLFGNRLRREARRFHALRRARCARRAARELRNEIYCKIAEVHGSLSSDPLTNVAHCARALRTIVEWKKRASIRCSCAHAHLACTEAHPTLGTLRVAVLARARESPFPFSAFIYLG